MPCSNLFGELAKTQESKNKRPKGEGLIERCYCEKQEENEHVQRKKNMQ